MSGVIRIKITETVDELKEIRKSTKNQELKERIQAWYWLKSEQVKTTGAIANLIGKHRLYGLVEPRTKDSFFAEFSHVDGICFQEYLKWLAIAYTEQLHIIQLDNGRLHTWSELELPDNVILVFQPPYCPQVNPIAVSKKRLLCWQRSTFQTLPSWIPFRQSIMDRETFL
jgi:hypothetical protein